jgi:hypothetical protein
MQNVARVLPMIIGAFVVQNVLLCLLILPAQLERGPRELPQPFLAISLGAAIAGVVYANLKLRPRQIASSREELPAPSKFQTDMLIALALLELCALLGIFLVAHAVWSYVLVGASLAGMVGAVWPPTMHYCRVLTESNERK